ncbi:hypothetical protein I7M03_09945, partial [Neisseria meningitidis]|nr:hypothetical protein [Neisseria meningitidis]
MSRRDSVPSMTQPLTVFQKGNSGGGGGGGVEGVTNVGGGKRGGGGFLVPLFVSAGVALPRLLEGLGFCGMLVGAETGGGEEFLGLGRSD